MTRARRRTLRKPDQTKRVGAIWDGLAQGSPEMVDAALERPVRAAPAQRTQPERDEVQRPLMVYLRRYLPAGSVVFAVPNMARSRAQLFSLVRDGMLPGIPDICICTTRTHKLCGDDETHSFIDHVTPWVGFIECKNPRGGTLSDAQSVVQEQLRALKLPVLSECRSIPEAVAWLQENGVRMQRNNP